jgi:hypothetical protein
MEGRMDDLDRIKQAYQDCILAMVFPEAVTETAEFRVLHFAITGDAIIDPPKKEFPDF